MVLREVEKSGVRLVQEGMRPMVVCCELGFGGKERAAAEGKNERDLRRERTIYFRREGTIEYEEEGTSDS